MSMLCQPSGYHINWIGFFCSPLKSKLLLLEIEPTHLSSILTYDLSKEKPKNIEANIEDTDFFALCLAENDLTRKTTASLILIFLPWPASKTMYALTSVTSSMCKFPVELRNTREKSCLPLRWHVQPVAISMKKYHTELTWMLKMCVPTPKLWVG